MEALEFYHSVFGGEIKHVQMSDDVEMFQEHKGKCLHAELHFGETVIHFSDIFDPIPKGENIRMMLECDSEAEIQRVYEYLGQDGQIRLPLQKTFWGALHAHVFDKFGICWTLNCQLPSSPE